MSEYDTANEHVLCFKIGKLKRRIAELEGEVTRLLTERDDAIMAEARYIAEVELAKKDARIDELEAELEHVIEVGNYGWDVIRKYGWEEKEINWWNTASDKAYKCLRKGK